MATKIKFKSPLGTASYPHLSKPDTEGKFADNKFKTKLVLPLGNPEAQAFIQVLKEAAQEIHGSNGLKLHMPFVENEEANEVTFTFKSQYAPAIFDTRGKQLPEIKDAEGVRVGTKIKVGAGSQVRVSGIIVGYEKGISAQINQVQVKTLNGAGSSDFDEIEDGFTLDTAESTFDSDATVSFEGADASDGTSALDI